MANIAAGAGGGAVAAVAGVAGAQALSAALVPWAMATFGTVVIGVGTLHAAGGVAATLASFRTNPCPVAVVGGVVGGGAMLAVKMLS